LRFYSFSLSLSLSLSLQNFDQYFKGPLGLQMALPPLFKKALILDWEFVVQRKRVYQLPSDFSVKTLTTMYSSSGVACCGCGCGCGRAGGWVGMVVGV
jgi:hypothetical protein